MRSAGLEKDPAEVRIGEEKCNNLRYADDTTLVAANEEDLQRLLMKVKEKSEATGLYFNIKMAKVMTTEDLNEYKIGDEELEIVYEFNYLGVLIERKGGCERETRLGIGRSTMSNLRYMMKDKKISNKTKVKLAETLVVPIVTYGSESWTIKNGKESE